MSVHNYFSEKRPLVMGILNVTPDSFSDGGKYTEVEAAVQHAKKMLAEGADILDIGGQSTRPGYQEISPEEEEKRVVPVIKEIRSFTTVPVSIDTYFPKVAKAALVAGATIINDVKGFDDDGMLEVAKEFPDSGLIIMHSRQRNFEKSVQEDIQQFYQEKVERFLEEGIELQRLCFDPGIGFGKTIEENIEILKNPENFRYKELPVLYGVSRKRTIAAILEENDPLARDFGSVAASLFAAEKGADILRVHNVKGMADTLKVWKKLQS